MEKIRKRGILAVSFGTSYEDSCRQTIGALEERILRRIFPECR
ncbi:MAG: hypothetical protein ACLVAW_29860 [Eisenbergiella massiliensis]